MILFPTTTLHWLQGTDPADGYEDEAVVWADVAQVAAHVNFSSTSRTVGGGSVQWVTTAKFQCDTPPVDVDLHWRVTDEASGATYQLIDLDYSEVFDCLTGTLTAVSGVV